MATLRRSFIVVMVLCLICILRKDESGRCSDCQQAGVLHKVLPSQKFLFAMYVTLVLVLLCASQILHLHERDHHVYADLPPDFPNADRIPAALEGRHPRPQSVAAARRGHLVAQYDWDVPGQSPQPMGQPTVGQLAYAMRDEYGIDLYASTSDSEADSERQAAEVLESAVSMRVNARGDPDLEVTERREAPWALRPGEREDGSSGYTDSNSAESWPDTSDEEAMEAHYARMAVMWADDQQPPGAVF